MKWKDRLTDVYRSRNVNSKYSSMINMTQHVTNIIDWKPIC